MYAISAVTYMTKQLVILITESHREQSGKMYQRTGHALSAAQERKSSQLSEKTGGF